MDKRFEKIRLGDYLKQLRLAKNKTLNQAAFEVNISKSYLSKLENNDKENPSLYTIMKLAKYFNVPLQTFEKFCDENSPYVKDNNIKIKDIGQIIISEEYLFANTNIDLSFKIIFREFINYVEEILVKEANRIEEAKILEFIDIMRKEIMVNLKCEDII